MIYEIPADAYRHVHIQDLKTHADRPGTDKEGTAQDDEQPHTACTIRIHATSPGTILDEFNSEERHARTLGPLTANIANTCKTRRMRAQHTCEIRRNSATDTEGEKKKKGAKRIPGNPERYIKRMNQTAERQSINGHDGITAGTANSVVWSVVLRRGRSRYLEYQRAKAEQPSAEASAASWERNPAIRRGKSKEGPSIDHSATATTGSALTATAGATTAAPPRPLSAKPGDCTTRRHGGPMRRPHAASTNTTYRTACNTTTTPSGGHPPTTVHKGPGNARGDNADTAPCCTCLPPLSAVDTRGTMAPLVQS